MQQVAFQQETAPPSQELKDALPLYAASLIVTLAAIGAVGVTITSTGWTPVWAAVTVAGHLVSLALRRRGVSAGTVFYPVMGIGTLVILQLALMGSGLVGMEGATNGVPTDMAMAALVGCLAALRSFTLVTNESLLFTPVPGITMLALVGNINPNAEVFLFFGILLLGSLFITGYEAHLRRIARTGRRTAPVIFHLLVSWCVTLAVTATALLFPLLVQPVLGPLSPFALPAMGRMQGLIDFARASTNQAPVGQGPINLSPNPLYHIYTDAPGPFRTAVFAHYTGRGWTVEQPPDMTDISSETKVEVRPASVAGGAILYPHSSYLYRFGRDPELGEGVPVRKVSMRVETVGYGAEGIPAAGHITELRYPRSHVNIHANGYVTGNGHQGRGNVIEMECEVPEFSEERLRAAPALDLSAFSEPETLSLPQSTFPVGKLARKVTQGASGEYDKIRAILAHIEKTCTYTLQEVPTPPDEDAAAFYLLRTKRGACDLAATAAVVMCRSVGIPARVAIGYVGEEQLPDGRGWLVRHEHLHMWVEAFFPGCGWVPFNPSPPMAGLHENPLQVALYRIQGAFGKIGGGGMDAALLMVVVLITLGLAGYGGWKRLRAWLQQQERTRRAAQDTPGAAIALVYSRALRLLQKRGWGREPWMTSREYLELLRSEWESREDGAPALARMEALTECFQEAHYAGNAPADAVQRASQALRELSRLAPRRRPAPRLREKPSRRAESPA
jgi:hypothetical protein